MYTRVWIFGFGSLDLAKTQYNGGHVHPYVIFRHLLKIFEINTIWMYINAKYVPICTKLQYSCEFGVLCLKPINFYSAKCPLVPILMEPVITFNPGTERWIKSLIHYRTSAMQTLKIGNGLVISSHTLLGILTVRCGVRCVCTEIIYYEFKGGIRFEGSNDELWVMSDQLVELALPEKAMTNAVISVIATYYCVCVKYRTKYTCLGTISATWIDRHLFPWCHGDPNIPTKITLRTTHLYGIQAEWYVPWYSTHWGRNEMNNISQTTFSSISSSMKIFEFRLKFHWSLFPRVQLTILQHCFR